MPVVGQSQQEAEAEVNQVECLWSGVTAGMSEGREGCVMSGGSLLSLVISLYQPCSFSIASSCLSLPIINLSDVGLLYQLTK